MGYDAGVEGGGKVVIPRLGLACLVIRLNWRRLVVKRGEQGLLESPIGRCRAEETSDDMERESR